MLFRLLISLVSIQKCASTRLGAPEYHVTTSSTTSRHLYFENVDLSEVSLCGCDSCYDKGVSGYETRTGQESCAQRIMGLIADKHLAEEAACTQIAKTASPDECGEICDPRLCDGRAELSARQDDPSGKPEKTFCGCASCTTDAWIRMAGEFSCGARISYVTDYQGKTEREACRKVAGDEFSEICGACNPDTCKTVDPHQFSPNTQEVAAEPSNDPPMQPQFADISLTPNFPLYCFPAYNDRVRYENVWGKYTLEVKESDAACGPSDNFFDRRAVQLQNDELALRFLKVGDRWTAGEVRVLLPQEEMPFHYGEFSWSVKSIAVIDSSSGAIVDTVLPVTMILGLFSWDATEDYARHENYNHEVDIEISRWNIEDLADVQYLVQPPGDPHKYRFFSGEGETYQQAPHTYKFDWKPAEIDWGSSAGGGEHTFTYGTQDALDAGQPDYTQCMPADVEVRMNLWNLFGSATPKGLQDNHIVEVVIDNFQFTPSGLTGVSKGGTCSKDCQCDGALKCKRNTCILTDAPDVEPIMSELYGGGTSPMFPGSISGNSSTVTSGKENNESQPVYAANGKEAVNGGSGGGMTKAGKALIVVFFLMLVIVVGVVYVRRRRKDTSESRITSFTRRVNLSRMITFKDGNPNKKVVVECWEEDTDQISSFESSFEMAIAGK